MSYIVNSFTALPSLCCLSLWTNIGNEKTTSKRSSFRAALHKQPTKAQLDHFCSRREPYTLRSKPLYARNVLIILYHARFTRNASIEKKRSRPSSKRIRVWGNYMYQAVGSIATMRTCIHVLYPCIRVPAHILHTTEATDIVRISLSPS